MFDKLVDVGTVPHVRLAVAVDVQIGERWAVDSEPYGILWEMLQDLAFTPGSRIRPLLAVAKACMAMCGAAARLAWPDHRNIVATPVAWHRQPLSRGIYSYSPRTGISSCLPG